MVTTFLGFPPLSRKSTPKTIQLPKCKLAPSKMLGLRKWREIGGKFVLKIRIPSLIACIRNTWIRRAKVTGEK